LWQATSDRHWLTKYAMFLLLMLSNKQNLFRDVPLLIHAITPARRGGRLNRTALLHRSVPSQLVNQMTISLISLHYNQNSCSTFTTNLNSLACTFEFLHCSIHLHCPSGFPSNSGIQEIRSTYYPQNFLSVWSTPSVQRWHTSSLHWQTWSLRNLSTASSSTSHWTQTKWQ